ncbi:type II toxin-antitoxin system RelE/ParE family toxin [Marixanthomonas spongiae]|uniref:Type II toxin-antitoxin system RelE/ParE family toxin n=1 Tax=Marixanthomonas spongiae TaxID=2174845 RepID=A0A2U0I7U1_9FLAO|nr:type II toxin-antitoxin system RelE/ParE family toxin [Marixanthomonas spongiae]PVW17158.1 type II toxin-antitoxin system RelE/ParE family toxin [Marixanthomonas spongiae]
MDLKIFWTDFAKAELRKIFIYLKEHASNRVAKNENRKIVLATLRLRTQPEIGQIEPRLKNRTKEFRYLVHQKKIIYWVNTKKKQIEIIDVFDTQQYPDKIKKNQVKPIITTCSLIAKHFFEHTRITYP